MKTSHLRGACRSVPFALAVGIAAGMSTDTLAALDMFLEISGLPGESRDKAHPGDIDVLAFTQGVGRLDCPRFTITKFVDRASPGLQAASSNKTFLSSATLIVRVAGAVPIEQYKIDMTHIVIDSVKVDATGGSDRATEDIVLAPTQVNIRYVPQKLDGTADTAVLSAYSCQTG